jgi:hypothetical protein
MTLFMPFCRKKSKNGKTIHQNKNYKYSTMMNIYDRMTLSPIIVDDRRTHFTTVSGCG